ncbi:MAG: carbohydrate ABC transporter permease [Clostridia bacterium]|nr:carbohydrate ABC transporter permease [Clostridia bacterium]
MTKNTAAASPLKDYRAAKVRQVTVSIFANLLRYAFLIAFSYILLYPIIYILTHSFRDPIDVTDPTILWVPKNLSWEPMKEAIEKMNLPTSLWSTLKLEVVSALISTATCGVAAYGMARFKFRGRGVLNFILLLTILIPASIVIIPNYMNFYDFNPFGLVHLIENIFNTDLNTSLLGTVWTFWLPALTGVGIRAGFYIYIYMQFYKGLPKELEEAAWVDGCGPWGTYLRIVVPSSGVSVLTVSMLAVIWHWNDYYNALMYFQSDHTMAVEISNFMSKVLTQGGHRIETDAPMAASLLFLLPVLIMYMVLQKKFITSIASTGIVG